MADTPKLKICGITRLEDARYCAAAGADYLGFIQYPESPRYVDPKTAREIVDWVYGPTPVGVFVNAGADEVNRTADAAGFALVQLHGDEPPALCAEIERPIIKALPVGDETTAGELAEAIDRYAGHVDYFLLDTRRPGLRGGTGTPFDWEIARGLAQEHRLFVAGGIGRDNVEEAVRLLDPYGVDLSSSVEERPGVKDFDKLADFFDTFDALRQRST